LDKLRKNEVGTQELDDKVRRVLRLVFRTTMSKNRPYGSFATEEHAAAGRRIAEEGIVLLQNNKELLPVDLSKVKKIVVVGENAEKRMTIGGGSSSLKVKYEVSPLAGIRARVGDQAEVIYVKGYESPAVVEQDVKGAKAPEQKPIDAAALRAEAVTAAQDADVVLFIGGLNKNDGQDCEGNDRSSLNLPYEQDELIAALAAANPRLAVVIISGNAVAMPWVASVPSILEAWYSGSESGNALAAVLFGDANPSGKLPFTFPVRLEDNGAHTMGEWPGDGENVTYNEGIFVGYRWIDQQQLQPLFAFGHGLSYTTFAYSDVSIDRTSMTTKGSVNVSVTVTNTGNRAGAEVVQLYIADKQSSLPRPTKELKGFEKIHLEKGASQRVTFPIDVEMLKFYDDTKGEWIAESGAFEAFVGASSTDMKGVVGFELK
ncbi:MAG: glycoside hydrolase family 3 C-terminal domain-containing protein, partial [Alistipes sp.]